MSDPLAQVIAAEERGRSVLRVSGEVDMSNVAAVGEQLRAAAGDAPSVLVDLTELGFLDSQGLRMIQRFADELAGHGKKLIIVAPASGVVGSLLALTGMDKNLDIRQSPPQ
ncbi:STAS domain-containing protein [Catellatospora vulcania]|uniref:STAS domain-containing protein n=1 Tax=Catellatospora vulcania TaxID=1460450 RepID=UPI0012D4BD73|nr:STAS domain-containing protein [Catellatospora vulcania]